MLRARILRAVRSARRFAELAVGARSTFSRVVTESDVRDFAALTGDDNAIHLDDGFAATTRFGRRIAHGALSIGFLAAAQTRLVGSGAVWIDAALRFTAPVHIGDTVTATSEIIALETDRRTLTVRTTCRVADGTVVLTGDSRIKHPRELS